MSNIPPSSPPPLRILRVIARLNVGGPARHVASVTLGLDPARFEQRLLAGRVQAGEDDMGPLLQAQGLTYTEIKGLGRSLHPLRDLACLLRLMGEILRFRPQVVETHTAKAGAVGRTAAWLCGPLLWLLRAPRPKAIHMFHGHVFHGYFSPRVTRFFLALERGLARWATWRILALSPAQKKELVETYGVGRPDQVEVLPLGIPLPDLDQAPAGRAAFRAQLGVGEDQFLVGAVGRVAPVKNYGLMLEAAARLQDLRPDLAATTRWALIGGGSPADLQALQTQARELGLADRVILAGSRDDPQCFYPGLDALILTSLNEGTPMVILEAGTWGKPVLATLVGGVPDLLGPEQEQPAAPGLSLRKQGLGAASGDAQALARGVIWLRENPERAVALGAALGRHVKEAHGLPRLLDQVARLYQEAAGRSGA